MEGSAALWEVVRADLLVLTRLGARNLAILGGLAPFGTGKASGGLPDLAECPLRILIRFG